MIITLHPNFRGSVPVSKVMEALTQAHGLCPSEIRSLREEVSHNENLLQERDHASRFGTIGYDEYVRLILAHPLNQ